MADNSKFSVMKFSFLIGICFAVVWLVIPPGKLAERAARDVMEGSQERTTQQAGSAEYATIQYTDNSTGISFVVFQEAAGDETFCRDLNQNFIRGLQTNCTSCVVELQGCDRELPSAYREIFRDVPAALPYISAPHLRIVVFGSPEASEICFEQADVLRRVMNQEVRCISW